MRILDTFKISQRNLFRAKLRTTLTILAVFIGTFTISITTGVGNGVKAYVDQELGNVGVENTLIVQAKSTNGNPLSSDVAKYDPNEKTGDFNQIALTSADIKTIEGVSGVTRVIPNYTIEIAYIAGTGDKYKSSASQYMEGLNLNMAAGRVINIGSTEEVTIPIRYVSPLGYSSAADAIGKKLVLGYKNSQGLIMEKPLTIVGVQQESILGNASIYIDPGLAGSINIDQTAGIAGASDVYLSLLVEFDKNLTVEQIDALKQVLNANNYTASTIQDQIGTFSKVINGISVGLNVFGIVALLVAAFGIVNTLLMAVNERTSEIGLMKALGANSRTVFAIFSMEAASIGFWGALFGLGISIGVGTILNSYASNHFLKDFTGFNLLAFPPAYSLAILAGIVVLAFLAGTLPSIKASKLDPIKALRYE